MKKILTTIILFGTSLIAHSTDLKSLYDIALKQDPTLNSAEANYNANAQLSPAARGALLPQIDLAVVDSRAKSAITAQTIATSHGINLNLQQALINFQAWYGYKQASNLAKQAHDLYVANQQALIIRLTQAYFNVLKAKDTLSFKTAQKNAVSQQLEQIEQKFEVGLVPITDKKEAQANFDLASADEIQAENDLNTAYDNLQEIIGQPVGELAVLKETFPLKLPSPISVTDWIKVAKENSPTLHAAESAYRAASNNTHLEYAKQLPSLSVSAGNDYTRGGHIWNSSGSTTKSWNVQFAVTMNLFSGGSQWSLAKKAAFEAERASYELIKTKRETNSSTQTAYRSVIAAISQTKALKEAVESAETALKATEAANEVGTRTIVEVLNSIAQLYNSKEKYTQARHAYILNQLLLKQSAGILSVTDLNEVNQLLVENHGPK